MTQQQKENLSKGKKFTSEYQPNNTGRKPSKLKAMIEVNDLSSNDVSDLLLSLFDKTEDELTAIAFDQNKPFLVRTFVKAMLKDLSQDSIYNINNLLDRAIGKPKEKTQLTTLGEQGEEKGITINISMPEANES